MNAHVVSMDAAASAVLYSTFGVGMVFFFVSVRVSAHEIRIQMDMSGAGLQPEE